MTDEKNIPAAAADPAEVPVTDASYDAFAPADEASAADAHDDRDDTYDSVAEAFTALTDGPDAVDATAPPQYGVGPFSAREVALGAIGIVALIVSFFPVYTFQGATSVWTSGIDWILTIGVPTVAVFLVGLRRLSPQGIRRVGSLGIDQFASVAFSVSTLIWLGILWNSFVTLAVRREFYVSWVVWVEFILMLAGVLLTVFAPLFPTIGDDFRHRSEVPAHRVASPARPVVARPATPRPAAAAPAAAPASDATPDATAQADAAQFAEATPYAAATDETAATDVAGEPIADDTVTTADAAWQRESATPPASQAFWALAPVERDVIDESGTPIFVVGPTAWALVIEDRGHTYVIRHEDGRIGYLTDVSGITRG